MTNYRSYYNLLLKNWPQYEQLRQELLKLFFRQALHEKGFVDCYIDLNDYLRPLYETREGDYEYDEPKSVAASIINFCAHLREFFSSRFSMRSRFFLVYGNNRPDEVVKYIPDYDAHRAMDRATKMNIYSIIMENLNFLAVTCPYLPEIYYVENQTVEPAVIIRSLIKEQSLKGAKHARLIFSKDIYDLQLVATVPNTHLIRVKKTMQGDQTYTVSFFDFYKKLSMILKLKNNIGNNASPELYSVYLTLAGCRSRGVKGLITLPRANTLINGSICEGRILNGYSPSFSVDPLSWSPFVECIKCSNNEDLYNNLYNRFCGLDLIHQCNLFRISSSYNTLESGIVDLYDPEGVKIANNTFFKKYPLDLNVL